MSEPFWVLLGSSFVCPFKRPASDSSFKGHHTNVKVSSLISVVVNRDSDLVQPPMMTFKSFLTTQDDGISDEDAIKKYSEYKLEFKRQQLNEFFVNHKDEEW